MAEGGETRVRVIKNAPTTSKADIWAHFGFYEQPGKHDLEKTHPVCKSCHTQIKYAGGNTQWCSGGYMQVYGVYPLLYQPPLCIPTSKSLLMRNIQ